MPLRMNRSQPQTPQSVEDADRMEGSVFDTVKDKAIRGGMGVVRGLANDPMGGMSPMPMAGGAGIVVNPEHWIHQLLRRYAPAVAKYAEEAPGKIQYVDYGPAQYMKEAGRRYEDKPVTRGPLGFTKIANTNVNPSEKTFVSLNPSLGGKYETASRGVTTGNNMDWRPTTATHEVFTHANPSASSGGNLLYPYTEPQALHLLRQELENPHSIYSPTELKNLMGFYQKYGGPAHAMGEVESNKIVAQHGGQPFIMRNLEQTVDKSDVQDAMRLLRLR